MEEITIGKIYHNAEKQDGSKYIDKRGKNFTLVTIYTTINGRDLKMSYVDYDGKTIDWKEGEIKKVKITQNGQYINFAPPGKLDIMEVELERLKKRVETLEATPTR